MNFCMIIDVSIIKLIFQKELILTRQMHKKSDMSVCIKYSQINGLAKYFDSNKKYMNRFSHDIKKY